MKLVARRHKKDGFDVCDEQHCQVYSGAAAETERSRMVVNATRGRVLAYKGRIAHGIYSSNCGGHTQGGGEIVGWGDVGYWPAVQDSPPGSPARAGGISGPATWPTSLKKASGRFWGMRDSPSSAGNAMHGRSAPIISSPG